MSRPAGAARNMRSPFPQGAQPREPVRLEDDQLHELAHLIAEELRGRPAGAQPAERNTGGTDNAGGGVIEALTAGQLAERLGVSRRFVYEHAAELGAVRLGSGPKAPLRFELSRAVALLYGYGPSRRETAEPGGRRPRRRRRVSNGLPEPGGVLSIRARVAPG